MKIGFFLFRIKICQKQDQFIPKRPMQCSLKKYINYSSYCSLNSLLDAINSTFLSISIALLDGIVSIRLLVFMYRLILLRSPPDSCSLAFVPYYISDRNRAKAASDPSTFVHIPYRQSKLSHMLKDAFELESYKPSKTVVIANVAPSYVDLSMTLNTLR